MGVEVAIAAAIASAAYGGFSSYQAAKEEQKANTKTAENTAENIRRQTAQKVANLQSSFLSSGFLLEGSPSELIQQTYDVGQEDITRVFANTAAANQALAKKARNSVVQSLLGTASSTASLMYRPTKGGVDAETK